MDSRIEQISSVLMGDNPRQSAERVLAFFVGSSFAVSGAVFSPDDELQLLVHEKLSAATAGDVRFLWSTHGPALRAGHAVKDTAHVLAPLSVNGDLVGLLYLAHPRTFPQAQWTGFLIALANAVRLMRSESSTPSTALAVPLISPSEVKREALLVALHKTGGNVSEVARIIQVTRRTVYARMRRYGIKVDRGGAGTEP